MIERILYNYKIKRMFLTTAEKLKYSELRLEESKAKLDKVKLARSEYRSKGKYIEEVLKWKNSIAMTISYVNSKAKYLKDLCLN